MLTGMGKELHIILQEQGCNINFKLRRCNFNNIAEVLVMAMKVIFQE